VDPPQVRVLAGKSNISQVVCLGQMLWSIERLQAYLRRGLIGRLGRSNVQNGVAAYKFLGDKMRRSLENHRGIGKDLSWKV
jgi:hypothetical protein